MLQSQFTDSVMEAGCDEAGRGSLAGPVYAAAVILPKGYIHPVLTDSKLLNASQRESLRKEIDREAISWAIGRVEANVIDEINILQATFLAFRRAIEKLSPPPGLLLIDGNRFSGFRNIPYHCIIKGDTLYYSIAAASVLAKTYRDREMDVLHEKYPGYGWNRNRGYATTEHRRAIEKYGMTEHHRKSFHLKNQLTITF